MKTKTILASALVATFALSAVAPAVLAADVEGSPHPSKSSVGFTAPTGEGATDPTEVTPPAINPPIKPGKPDPGNDGTDGPLGLSVPTDLQFGSDNAISATDKDYYALLTSFKEEGATGETYKLPPMIVVKDVRGKADGKWALSASATEFYEVGAKANVLPGTTLSFKDAQVFNSQADDFTAGNLIVKAKGGNVTLGTAATELLKATGGHGNGETTYVGDSAYDVDGAATQYKEADKRVDGIVLTVPQKASGLIDVAKSYQSDIVWTLSDDASL